MMSQILHVSRGDVVLYEYACLPMMEYLMDLVLGVDKQLLGLA